MSLSAGPYSDDMPIRRIVAPQATASDPQHRGPLERAFARLRDELELPDVYPQPALDEAVAAVAAQQLPERDETALPLWTIDPAGSTDLDQAMHLSRSGEGYLVRYAIADVPAFVRPGGELDAETMRRGQTIYFPDLRVPLHPEVISEDAGSLLPDQVRSAYLWELHLDAVGGVQEARVALARVRSAQRYDYAQVQQLIDDGSAPPDLALLKEIGEKRLALERARGGASLPMPEQEVTLLDGDYRVQFRPPLPAEDWNAQISLMTGMAAADLMLSAKVGVLRTMPEAEPGAVDRFRRQAAALGVPWPSNQAYGEFLRTLDSTDPRHLALIHAATSLFRGAGYTIFDGDLPELTTQAAVAAPYAHVTAPLRRLVDRFGLAACAAISAGEPVPDWVRAALPQVPEVMSRTGQVAGRAERASADAVEAAVLSGHVGARLPATVIEVKGNGKAADASAPATPGAAVAKEAPKPRVMVQFLDLPVEHEAAGSAEPGQQVDVEVAGVDIEAGRIELRLV